jgi:predicted deacylase
MAFALMSEAAAKAHAWVDLHGGDIHEALVPIGGYESDAAPSVCEQARAMIEVFGVEYAARTYNLLGTALHTATRAGIPSILAEAGQQGRRDEDDTMLLVQGCRNVAQLLGLLPGALLPESKPQMLARIDWVHAEHRGCWYPTVTLREHIEQGHIIGLIKDYFGHVVAEYRAPHSGIVVLSCTSLAVREQHTLVGVGILT